MHLNSVFAWLQIEGVAGQEESGRAQKVAPNPNLLMVIVGVVFKCLSVQSYRIQVLLLWLCFAWGLCLGAFGVAYSVASVIRLPANCPTASAALARKPGWCSSFALYR